MAAKTKAGKAESPKAGANPAGDTTGMGFARPEGSCTDGNCPFHGKLRLHGRRLNGVVFSAKMRKTANILIDRMTFLKKYDRYERKRSRVKAHNPECISAKDGDRVEVVECRPLSRTKHFVIVRKG